MKTDKSAMEEVKFPIDNTYIHCVKFGEGSKNLVVVSGISLRGFEGFGAAIAARYRENFADYSCYVFDRKIKLKRDCTIEDLAEDLYRVLKSISISSAKFLGVSQGGMITLALALRHPEMVEAMVIGSSAAWSTPISRATWVESRGYLNSGDIYNFNKNLYKHIYSDKFLNDNAGALERIYGLGNQEQAERFIALIDAIDMFDVRETVYNIQCPSLIMGAENDKIFGLEASVELSHLLNCKLHVCKAQAHSAYDEDETYLEIVRDFFDKHE